MVLQRSTNLQRTDFLSGNDPTSLGDFPPCQYQGSWHLSVRGGWGKESSWTTERQQESAPEWGWRTPRAWWVLEADRHWQLTTEVWHSPNVPSFLLMKQFHWGRSQHWDSGNVGPYLTSRRWVSIRITNGNTILLTLIGFRGGRWHNPGQWDVNGVC